jgi:hypothetical protein
MRRPEIERLLPSVYQLALNPVEGWVMEPDHRLGAILDAMEALHHPIEQILDGLDAWLDPRRTPDAFVPYLAGWVDLDRLAGAGFRKRVAEAADARSAMAAGITASLPASGMARLRELVAAASDLARWRGTARGLLRFLQVATGIQGFTVDEEPRDASGRRLPFHIVVHGPAAAEPMRPLIERIVDSEKPAYVRADIVLGGHQEGVPS